MIMHRKEWLPCCLFQVDRLARGTAAAALVLLQVLLGSGYGHADDRLPVVASIVPLQDFCEEVGGDRVDVQLLIPPGASPHLYEPPPSVIGKAAAAKVVVYVGAGLEPWIDRILSTRSAQSVLTVEAVQGIDLIGSAKEEHLHSSAGRSAAEESPHRSGNPHVWLDPVLAGQICQRIAGAFQQADPDHAESYKKRLAEYLGQLTRLDAEIRDRVAAFRIRQYVCFHPSFSYFAARYGLEQVGVIESAPGREPTPRHLQRIVEAIRRFGIRVVFAEPQLSARAAEVIAQEAGIKVVTLDPIGGRPPYGDDYLKLMRYNVSMMEKGMK
jgi:zinc transport system substrate-binding protein